MLRTREEIALLLQQAAGNLQKTNEIYRELELLRVYIEDLLNRKPQSAKPTPGSKEYKRG